MQQIIDKKSSSAESMSRRTTLIILLHFSLLFYSVASILAKLASALPFKSILFFTIYALEIFILFIYAISWQRIIKEIPLSVAYSHKAIVIVWGCIFGNFVFHEQITLGKLIGIFLIIIGISLYGVTSEKLNSLK